MSLSLPKLSLYSPRSNQSKNNHNGSSKSLTKRYYSLSKQLARTSTCACTSRDTYRPAVNYGSTTRKYPEGFHKNIAVPNYYLDYEPALSYYPKNQDRFELQKNYESYTNPMQSEYWSCAHRDVYKQTGQSKKQGENSLQKYPRGTQTPLYGTHAKSTETEMEILSRNQEKPLQKVTEDKGKNENNRGWGKYVKWKSGQQDYQKREGVEDKELSFSHHNLSHENSGRDEIGDLSKSQIQRIEPMNDNNKRTFSEAILNQIMGKHDGEEQNSYENKYDVGEQGEKGIKKYNENNKFSEVIMGRVTKTVESNQSQVIKNIDSYNRQENYVHNSKYNSQNSNNLDNQHTHQYNQRVNNETEQAHKNQQAANQNRFNTIQGNAQYHNQQTAHIQNPRGDIQSPYSHPNQLSTVKTTSLTIPPPAPHYFQNSHSQTPAPVAYQSSLEWNYMNRQSESFENRIKKIRDEFNDMKLELDDTTQIHLDKIIDSKNEYIDYSYKFIEDLNKIIGDGVIQNRRGKAHVHPPNGSNPQRGPAATHFGISTIPQPNAQYTNSQQYHNNNHSNIPVSPNTLQVPQLRVLSPSSSNHSSSPNKHQHQQVYQLPPYQMNARPSQLPYHNPHPNLKSQTLVQFHSTSNSQSPQRQSLPHSSFNQNTHFSHVPQNVIVSVPVTTIVRPPTPLPPPLPQQITKQVQFKRSGASSSQGSKSFIPI